MGRKEQEESTSFLKKRSKKLLHDWASVLAGIMGGFIRLQHVPAHFSL